VAAPNLNVPFKTTDIKGLEDTAIALVCTGGRKLRTGLSADYPTGRNANGVGR